MSTSQYIEAFDFESFRRHMLRRAVRLGYSYQDAEDLASECVRIRLSRWGKSHQTNSQTFTDACRIEGHIQRTSHQAGFTAKWLERQAVVTDPTDFSIIRDDNNPEELLIAIEIVTDRLRC